MKLKPLDSSMALQEIDYFHKLKPITKAPLIASQMELIYLGTNLLLKSSLLIRCEIQSTKTAQECTSEAIGLMNIINSYDTRYLIISEVARVRRDFKVPLQL